MHLRRLLLGLLALCFAGWAPAALAAPPSSISYTVGVCDPWFPTRCQQAGPFVPDAISNTTLSVSGASGNTALPGTGQTVLVFNTGAADTYVKLGGSTVTAATTNFLIQAGSSAALARQTATYIAGITDGSTSTLLIETGNGTTGAGAGGGGGGGGGTVTVTNPFNLEATQLLIKADLDALAAAISSSIPAGSALIGHTDGAGAAAASLVGNPNRQGCRAADADPTAVTNAQLVDNMCSLSGKQIVLPYALKELQVRGSTGAQTGTGAQTVIASAGGSLKNYIVACQLTNSGANTSIVTLNDSASTVLMNPAGGGSQYTFPVPLATAAATALTANFATASTSQYAACQGYTGL